MVGRVATRSSLVRLSSANNLPPLRHFFERSCVACTRDEAEMGQSTRCTFQRNTASMMKDLVWYEKRLNLFKKVLDSVGRNGYHSAGHITQNNYKIETLQTV